MRVGCHFRIEVPALSNIAFHEILIYLVSVNCVQEQRSSGGGKLLKCEQMFLLNSQLFIGSIPVAGGKCQSTYL